MSYTKEFSFSQNKPVEEFLASFNRGIEITFILKDPVQMFVKADAVEMISF